MVHFRRAVALAVVAAVLGGASPALAQGIALDNATASNGGTTSLSFNHTIGGGSNRYLVLAIGLNKFMSAAITGVTYNSTAMTQIGTETVGGGCGSTLWGLADASLPAAGTYSVSITVGGSGVNRIYATALSYTGVDQNNLPSSKSTNSSTSDTNPTVDVTTSRAQYVVDCACLRSSGSMTSASLTVGASQTERSNQAAQLVAVGVSNEPGANVASPSTGTTTMSWTGSVTGSINGWATSAIVLKPASTTAVRLDDLAARSVAGGARLVWSTGFEVDHLGFHVLREDPAGRTRLTASPILGSGWLAGPGVALAAGRSYAFDDVWPPGRQQARYWLEEVDMAGRRRLHGPVVARGPGRDIPAVAGANAAAAPTAAAAPPPPWAEAPFLVAGEESPTQWALASGPAVKLSVNQEGWYEVPQPALLAAGLAADTDPRRLALFADGREVSLLVRGEEDGRLDPSDRIGFYGRGLNAPSTDTRVYWLATREAPGHRLERPPSASAGVRPTWYPETIEQRPRQVYFAALRDPGGNKIFGPVVGPSPLGTTLPIADRVAVESDPPRLEVGLQGSSFTPHAVSVTVDGKPLAVARFDGRAHHVERLPIPGELPVDGAIEVGLQSAGGDADVVLLDFVRLTHPRAFVAHDGLLRASASGGAWVRMSGFAPGEPAMVLDVTDEARPVLLLDGRADEAGALEVGVPGAGTRQLLACARPRSPLVAANRPSRWSALQEGADLVAIGPPTLLEELAPLAGKREAEGWRVARVDVEDVYDEFSFGARHPQALRSFAARARAWTRPPRAFLLLGDASFDPRDLLGKGALDVVPTKLVETAYLETASDDWFTDLDEDGIADVPVGRLPARTAPQLAAMVAKLVAAPVLVDGEGTGRAPLVFVAGNDDDTSPFSQAVAQLRSMVPPHLATVLVDGRSAPDPAAQLGALLAAGPPLITYVGHGSETQWAGRLLSNETATTLPGAGPGAFLISLTCLNGFFQDVYQPSLGEVLLAREQGGAFGVWASSGLSGVQEQAAMGRAFLQHLLVSGLTVGEAAARAKAATVDRDVRRTWVLLGDPTWRLIAASVAPPPPPPPDAAAPPDAAPKSLPASHDGCSCSAKGANAGSILPGIILLLALVRSIRRR